MVINGDTVVAITPQQAKKINKTFIKMNYYRTVRDSLNSKIVLLDAKIENDSIIIGNLKVKAEKLEDILLNKQEVIDRLVEDLAATDKELKKQIRRKKIGKGLLFISMAANAIFTVIMVVQ